MCLNETYSKVHIGKYLSDIFPIQNGLKQRDALSPLHFNFALEYGMRKIHENQMGLKLLAYADVNLLQDNIDTIKENTETVIDASKEVGIEINVDKIKLMLLSSPVCRSKSEHKNSKQIVCKCVTVKIYGNDSNKSKFDPGGH
jgi:hypothetical protein